MKIIAGIGLDGRKPNTTPPQLNTLVCGEKGLISELEFRAGIIPLSQSSAERAVCYMEAIKQVDSPTRFFHNSFKTDPLSSAEALLIQRDWFYLHGWLPFSCHEPGRLGDFAAIEQALNGLSPCIGERIIALENKVNLITSTLGTIELQHPVDHWPTLYQQLFQLLQSAGVQVSEHTAVNQSCAKPNSDLGRLQNAILSGTTSPLTLTGDGSLRCYRTSNLQTAANYTAHVAGNNHLVISSGEGFALNTAASHAGHAELGLGERSSWRAPNQLLPLMLQCMWAPTSAQALQQYLTLPTGRFQKLRQTLARSFADLPGYDIVLWQEKISEFINNELSENPDLDTHKLETDINRWVLPARANNSNQMPTQLALELCEVVSQYWHARSAKELNSSSQAIYLTAYQAATALKKALQDWSDTTIRKEQLNRLLDLSRDTGNGLFQRPRQVSTINVIEQPEVTSHYTGDIDQLIWWNCRLGTPPKIPALTEEEKKNIPYYPTDQDLASHEQFRLQRALSPLLLAKENATLISLSEEPDLLILTLSQLLGESFWRPLNDALLTKLVTELTCNKMTNLSLPSPQRWWNLSTNLGAHRPIESYSSLEALALKPHEYVLKYSARLNEGALASLPVDARLKGNLAHRTIELWLNEVPWSGIAPTESTIALWLDNNLDELILKTALPFAGPGMRTEKLRYRHQLQHAMLELFQQLESGGIKAVRVEHKLTRSLVVTQLEGTIDLLCQLSDDRWVIIDMKWGSLKHHRETLKQGLHLQLATYGHLVADLPPKVVADVAYFIISEATLLTTSTSVFPGASLVKSESLNSHYSQIWSSFEHTCAWRMDQLKQGKIEVTYGSATADHDSEPPAGSLPVLQMESDANKSAAYGNKKPTFKRIDAWRIITGNIEE